MVTIKKTSDFTLVPGVNDATSEQCRRGVNNKIKNYKNSKSLFTGFRIEKITEVDIMSQQVNKR